MAVDVPDADSDAGVGSGSWVGVGLGVGVAAIPRTGAGVGVDMLAAIVAASRRTQCSCCRRNQQVPSVHELLHSLWPAHVALFPAVAHHGQVRVARNYSQTTSGASLSNGPGLSVYSASRHRELSPDEIALRSAITLLCPEASIGCGGEA